MNEILLAAARGARVQAVMGVEIACQCVHCGGENYFSKQMWVDLVPSAELALHPDDDHFRFGPIGSELRDAAERVEEREYLQDLLENYGIAAIDDYVSETQEFGCCWDEAMRATDLHKSLFLLILSESLASEGL